MNRTLIALTTMAAMFDQSMYNYDKPTRRTKVSELDFTPKERPIPKGCQKYTYKERFGILEVIAMNEKSALKKYNKWCAENSKEEI
jgi:hypothetical protein